MSVSNGNTPPEYNAPPLRGNIPAPDLNAFAELLIAQVFNQLNCHQVGTIVNFYAATQTADIQPGMQRLVPDTTSNPPQWKAKTPAMLVNVPVFVLSGGGGTLTFPVASGDTCLVLFNDRDLSNWQTTGNTQTPPLTTRTHNLSDGLAIVGFRNLANKISGYSTTDAVLQNGGSSVSLAAKVGVANQSTSLLSVLLAMNTQIIAGGGGSSATLINSLLK